MEQDTHIFGESDYLDANEYSISATVNVKPLSFLGRLEYINKAGDTERSGYYMVKTDKGTQKKFRLGINNEKILKNKFKCAGYGDIIGKVLILQVKKYNLGNGFIVADLKSEIK